MSSPWTKIGGKKTVSTSKAGASSVAKPLLTPCPSHLQKVPNGQKSPLWQKVCAHSYGTEINAPFEIRPLVWRFDIDEIHRGTVRRCTVVSDIQTMSILQKPIERPLSKDVSPPACDPLLSEDPLRRARGFRGNRWRVDRFQVSIGQKVMANSVLWDGSRSKGLKERFGTKPSV
jgi:hypothetical protein